MWKYRGAEVESRCWMVGSEVLSSRCWGSTKVIVDCAGNYAVASRVQRCRAGHPQKQVQVQRCRCRGAEVQRSRA